MGSGKGEHKNESNILPSKCLLCERGIYQSAFYVLCYCNKQFPDQWLTEKFYHSCSHHLQIGWCICFIPGLRLKEQPLSRAWHYLHVRRKRRVKTRKEEACNGSERLCSHLIDQSKSCGKVWWEMWMFSHRESLTASHMATGWDVWSSCSRAANNWENVIYHRELCIHTRTKHV